MKFWRFRVDDRDRWGVSDGECLREITGSLYDEFSVTPLRHTFASVRILSPVVPSKLVAVGLNYVDHARELGQPVPREPFIFIKATSAIIAAEDTILIAFPDHETHHEAELTVVMKHRAKNIAPDDALDYVLGYTCGNDVSDRTIQGIDGAPTRAKSLDTFAPIGPCISTDLDVDNLNIECYVNGEIRQSSNTAQLVFGVRDLVSFVSHMMTLMPGDAIMTGTPPGVGPIRPGDTVEVKIEGIGTLRNPVQLAGPYIAEGHSS